jgi:hypothetical protein
MKMKKARMSKWQVKGMMTVFFNIRGVIMTEWVPEGQMVNQKYLPLGGTDLASRTSNEEKAANVEIIKDSASKQYATPLIWLI